MRKRNGRSQHRMLSHALWFKLSFLFNPLTIVTCLGRSSNSFSNLAVLASIAHAYRGLPLCIKSLQQVLPDQQLLNWRWQVTWVYTQYSFYPHCSFSVKSLPQRCSYDSIRTDIDFKIEIITSVLHRLKRTVINELLAHGIVGFPHINIRSYVPSLKKPAHRELASPRSYPERRIMVVLFHWNVWFFPFIFSRRVSASPCHLRCPPLHSSPKPTSAYNNHPHRPHFYIQILPFCFRSFTLSQRTPHFGSGNLLPYCPNWGMTNVGMRYVFLAFSMLSYSFLLGPAFLHLWMYAGSGNANFFYAITLVYSLAQIILVSDALYSMLRLDWERNEGKELYKQDLKAIQI